MSLNRSPFAILFSVKSDAPESRTLVYLRRYLESLAHGDDDGRVSVVGDVYLPTNSDCFMMIFVQAVNAAAIEAHLTEYREAVHATVVELVSMTVVPDGRPQCSVVYAMFQPGDDTDREQLRTHESLPNSVTLRAVFPGGQPFDAVWLSDASPLEAQQAVRSSVSEPTVLGACAAGELDAFLQWKSAGSPVPEDTGTAPDVLLAQSAEASSFAIVNRGSSVAYYADSNYPYDHSTYTDLFKARKSINPGEKVSVSANVYVWSAPQGELHYSVNYSYEGGWGGPRSATLTTNANLPVLFAANSGNTLGFNLDKAPRFFIESPLKQWLEELLFEQTYSEPWPEDSYSGDDLKAYNYFLAQFGGVPVKNNTIIAGLVRDVQFPDGADFAESAFNEVKAHLLKVAEYFEYSNHWFGESGVIQAINAGVASVSTNDLIGAAALMGIPEGTSLEVVLMAIFGDLTKVISFIPEAGEVLAALIEVGLSTYELTQSAEDPIGAEVGQLADVLNEYVESVDAARGKQLSIINSDWGNLKAFAEGVISGKISESSFNDAHMSGPEADGNTSVTMPDSYLQAVAKGWSLVIYKALFAVRPGVLDDLYLWTNDTTPHANAYNPAGGNFTFTFNVPCSFPDKHGNPQPGFAAFSRYLDLSEPVVMKVHGNGANDLDVNPYEFYAGINGWPVKPPLIVVSGPPGTSYLFSLGF